MMSIADYFLFLLLPVLLQSPASAKPTKLSATFHNSSSDRYFAVFFQKQVHGRKFAQEKAMRFASIACPKDLTEEKAAVDAIVAQYSSVGDYPLAGVTIVAALLQSGHCHGATCPSGLNNGNNFKSSLLGGATHVWIEQAPPGPFSAMKTT